MFHRLGLHRHHHHHHECEEGRRHRGGRHHFGGEGEEHGRGGRGGRGGRHRLFEHGDLRLVLLALVARKPSHGYELIKAIEEASSGLYVPSPGVIYPTLTLLEEQDFLEPLTTGNGRKSYRITAAGEGELQKHQQVVDVILARLAGAGREHHRHGNLAEGIYDAMNRLRSLLRGNVMRADLTPQQVERINAALLTAVAAIESEMHIQPTQQEKN
ncbi:PadR family transcriptional regulator [Serratia marcescens]|uniref:PadR family transcriptional regulator n=2 Tax=Serratia TaxID=613 RepID=A0A656VGV8_SERMA|nr:MULTISPECIES: PadR family transcriptional regulator [Serratia]MBF8218952.1 PadR family transcriptional regulator [Serratia ureilytica]AVU29447.1 PadR family transcriptional regulator [Serratia marcescens]KMU51063.1 PadR family transcriptional regulator [Serratia marcescens]MBF4654743.1 PadR family transcriptional regulator [Serratia marcescens]MBF8244539.1 PadR family transcriptional regulator [Serratia ureilytica]